MIYIYYILYINHIVVYILYLSMRYSYSTAPQHPFYTHLLVYIHLFTHAHAHIYIYLHTNTNAHMLILIHSYMYTHIPILMLIHTYTPIYIPSNLLSNRSAMLIFLQGIPGCLPWGMVRMCNIYVVYKHVCMYIVFICMWVILPYTSLYVCICTCYVYNSMY